MGLECGPLTAPYRPSPDATGSQRPSTFVVNRKYFQEVAMRSKTKVTIIISILLIVVGFGTVFSRRLQNKPVQNKPVRVDKRSMTAALEVVKIEIRNDIQSAVVTLKNVSSKNINGI